MFQTKMESICKILENFLSAIYPVRFPRHPDQECILIVPDIINHQLRIGMGITNENKWKLKIEKIIDILTIHNITTNITKSGGNQI